MATERSRGSTYMLAAILGAIGGALVVTVAAKAIPRVMSQVIAGMRDAGCHPAEI